MRYKIKIFKEEEINQQRPYRNEISHSQDVEIFRADMNPDTTIEILNHLFRLESQQRAEVNDKEKDE